MRNSRTLGVILAAVTLAACSSKPSSEEINAAVREHVPSKAGTVAEFNSADAETRPEGDGFVVNFKAHLRTKEALYRVLDASKVAADVGADLGPFKELEDATRAAPEDVKSDLAEDLRRLSTRPTFIEQTVPARKPVDWYGSMHMKKLVDRWVITDVRTEVEPVLVGSSKNQLPSDAVELARAKDWLAELANQQHVMAQRLFDRTRARVAEEKAARSEAVAQSEKDARAKVVEAVQQQARQLPIRYAFRPAVLGGTGVLQLQSSTPMTLRLEVSRGYQHFAKDLQVAPGRTVSFGHLEGWGFKTGDVIRFSNSSFDPATVTVP